MSAIGNLSRDELRRLFELVVAFERDEGAAAHVALEDAEAAALAGQHDRESRRLRAAARHQVASSAARLLASMIALDRISAPPPSSGSAPDVPKERLQ